MLHQALSSERVREKPTREAYEPDSGDEGVDGHESEHAVVGGVFVALDAGDEDGGNHGEPEPGPPRAGVLLPTGKQRRHTQDDPGSRDRVGVSGGDAVCMVAAGGEQDESVEASGCEGARWVSSPRPAGPQRRMTEVLLQDLLVE